MSTKTFDSAVDRIPAERRKTGPWASMLAFFKAMEDGIAAAHQYERLIAAGVAPNRAARIVFETMTKKR